MRRSLCRLVVTLGLTAGAVVLSAPPAVAQVTTLPYQGLCTANVTATDLGTFTVGQSITVVLAPTCAWNPGGNVNVTVNGQAVGTKPVAANGTITVHITIISATQLSVDDPVLVTGQCGRNEVVGVGPSSVANTTVTATATFTVTCAAAAATPTPSSGVAFTGANIARAAAVGTLAIAIGLALVVLGRRRRTPAAPIAA